MVFTPVVSRNYYPGHKIVCILTSVYRIRNVGVRFIEPAFPDPVTSGRGGLDESSPYV